MQTGVGMGGGVRNFWIMQDVNYNVMGVLSDGPAGNDPHLMQPRLESFRGYWPWGDDKAGAMPTAVRVGMPDANKDS